MDDDPAAAEVMEGSLPIQTDLLPWELWRRRNLPRAGLAQCFTQLAEAADQIAATATFPHRNSASPGAVMIRGMGTGLV